MSASETLAKARKKASSGGGFGSWIGGGSSSRLEEARDLFTAAANQFKLEKKWKEAGDAFCEAANCSEKAGEEDDAANDYWAAGKAYKKTTNLELSTAALKKTIDLYLKKGRFRQAADRSKEIGQIFQQDGNLQGALEAYERAAEWYSQEDATATANACWKDVADLAAQLEQFPKAIQMFELVAKNSLNSPLTRYGVKDYYLKAGLCRLCTGDFVGTKRALEQYTQDDPNFAQQREYKFLHSIADAVESGDQEAYTQHVAEYDHMSKLDAWKTMILLKIKRSIQEEPGLL